MQYGFYFDQSRCVGCNTCTVACKDYNQVNPGPVRWKKLFIEDAGKDSNDLPVFQNLTMGCNHCAEPACVSSCGVGAIVKQDNGMVLINRDKCQGLLSCIAACPFATPKVASDSQEPDRKGTWKISHPTQKCKFCWERVADGRKPICVEACVARALDFGDIDVLQRKYVDAVRLNKQDFPYAYKTGGREDTMPSFLIKKRSRKLAIVKCAKTENFE